MALSTDSFWDVVRRNWLLTALVFVAVAVLAALLFLVTPPQWQDKGSILLVYPTSSTAAAEKAAAKNPFLLYGDNRTVAQAVVERMSGAPIEDELKKGIAGAAFSLSTSAENNASLQLIYLEASASSASGVLELEGRVRADVDSQLRAMQLDVGASSEALITTVPADAAGLPSSTPTAQIRSAIGLVGLAVIVWLVLLGAVESRQRRRVTHRDR